MKNKKLLTTIALVVGAITLSTAVFANYANSNGYSVYKEAIKKTLKADNYTLNTSLLLSYDDTVLTKTSLSEMYDKNGDTRLSRTDTNEEFGETRYSGSTYIYDDLFIDIRDSNVYVDDTLSKKELERRTGSLQINFDTEEQADKAINFVELLGDMFVGDLKNNFVLLSSDDNVATYNLELESFQIPEVVNAGVDMLFSKELGNNSYNEESLTGYMANLKTTPYLNKVTCLVSVDNEGRLLDNELTASIVGKDDSNVEHTVKLTFTINMADYGVTVPTRVDLENGSYENIQYASDYRMDSSIKERSDGSIKITAIDADGELPASSESFSITTIGEKENIIEITDAE